MKPFCENHLCDNEAAESVSVSVVDDKGRVRTQKRSLCCVCEQVFAWGCQHGRLTAFRALRLRGPKRKAAAGRYFDIVA